MRRPAALAMVALFLAGCAQKPAARPPAPSAPVSSTSFKITATQTATVSGAQQPPTYTTVAVSPTAVWVGGPGFLASSTDGSNWKSQPLTGVKPSDIAFVDATHGWLYGTLIDSCKTSSSCTYTLLATTDGGRSWEPRWTSDADELSGVEFVDPSTGFAIRRRQKACADCAVLVRTTDGGKVWSVVPGPAPISVHFTDPTRGWVMGTRCAAKASCHVGIYATMDGGGSWTEQVTTDVPVAQGGGPLAFADGQHGWALITNTGYCSMGGCWGDLYSTVDGSHWTLLQKTDHWRITAIQSPPGFPRQPVFTSASDGFIPVEAGAGPGVGGVAFTTDGGRTWSRVGQQRFWDIHAAATHGGTTVWAIGDRHGNENGTAFVIRSTDGGLTWSQALPALSPIGTLSFVSPTRGYGTGLPSDPAAVLATSDGGKTWRQVGRTVGMNPSTVSFVGANGWAGDTTATMVHSTDGGHAWQLLPPAPNEVLYLRFFDPTHGVRVTRHLAAGVQTLNVSFTSDGGQQWAAPRPVPAGTDFAAVAFADAQHAFLITLDGHKGYLLRHTVNGGATWTQIGLLPLRGYAPRSIFFLTPSVGWVGDGSRLLSTTDGGASWTAHDLGTLAPVALDFTSPKVGWLQDTSGAVLATNDGGANWHAP